jgi:hypothetical protein
MSNTLIDDIDRAKEGRTLIQDEKGSLIMKKDLTRCERFRIFLNQWWVFIAMIIAASQVAQAIISVLNYFRCR